jgi:MFS transporter, DHA1 family, multidrug resistance protein
MSATPTAGDGSSPKVTARLILSDPAVRTVILMIFVIMLGFGIIAPILPLYARSFGVGYEAASLLISAFALARLIFDPIAGPIVDRLGERMTSMLGVAVVGVSSLLAGIAPTFTLAVVFRGAGGAGSAIFFAALYSYLLKVVPRDRMARTLSLFFGALNIGIIAGGPLGGFIAHQFALNTPLFVYAGLCGLSALLYLRFMPDPAETAHGATAGAEPTLAGGYWRGLVGQVAALLRFRAFVTVLFLNLAFFWVVAGGYDTLVPLFARESLDVSTVGVGVLFTVAVLAEFAVLYPAGSLADRIGRKPVATVGMAGVAIMIMLVGWASSPLMMGILMGALGLMSGSAAAAPGAMLSDVVPGRGSGVPVSLFRFAGDLGFVLGPVVGGVVTSAYGFKAGFASMALPAVVALALLVGTQETLHRKRAQMGQEPLSVPVAGPPG